MYYIRQAQPDDLDILLKLAKTVHFINLPPDKDIIAGKIARSRASFKSALTGQKLKADGPDKGAVKNSPLFMFVIADSESNTCHGTSMIVARMGEPGHPNLSFELRRREFFSRDLQTGTTHTTAKLFLDESGPSEVGGLILAPSLRRSPQRLGKQISLVRFHYAGARRSQFSDHFIAEMMAPITPDGRSLFWDALGRKFINLSYTEADTFCQHSREFMMSLLPRDEIFLALLPPEARQVVGEVGSDTKPARRMLEQVGFRYTGRVDPFDGGPHLECKTDDISLVRATQRAEFLGVCPASAAKKQGFISADDEERGFRSVHTAFAQTESGIKVPREVADALGLDAGIKVHVTPFSLQNNDDAEPASASSSATGRRKKRPAAKA